MKKIILVVVGFMALGGLSGCGQDSSHSVNENSEVTGQTSKDSKNNKDDNATLIYLVAMDEVSQEDSLNIDCDDELVEVKINKKLSPQKALEELLTYEESNESLYNVFNLSDDLKIEKMVVANDFAIVTLSEDLVVDGMCNDSCVRAQITKTLMQFEEIDGVDIFVGDQELSSYLSEVSEEVLGDSIN